MKTSEDGMPPSPARRETKGQATRRKIIDTFIQTFAREGFTASIQEVADKSQVSQSTVLYHFKSKKELIGEAVLQILEHNNGLVAAKMSPKDPPLKSLEIYFEENLNWALHYVEEAQMILYLYYLASHLDEYKKMYSQIQQTSCSKIEAWLYSAQRENTLRSEIDIPQVAMGIHDTLLGGIVNFVSTEDYQKKKKNLSLRWKRMIADLTKNPQVRLDH